MGIAVFFGTLNISSAQQLPKLSVGYRYSQFYSHSAWVVEGSEEEIIRHSRIDYSFEPYHEIYTRVGRFYALFGVSEAAVNGEINFQKYDLEERFQMFTAGFTFLESEKNVYIQNAAFYRFMGLPVVVGKKSDAGTTEWKGEFSENHWIGITTTVTPLKQGLNYYLSISYGLLSYTKTEDDSTWAFIPLQGEIGLRYSTVMQKVALGVRAGYNVFTPFLLPMNKDSDLSLSTGIFGGWTLSVIMGF